MKQKLLVLILLTLFISIKSIAEARTGVYAEVTAGSASILNDNSTFVDESGAGLGAGAGVGFLFLAAGVYYVNLKGDLKFTDTAGTAFSGIKFKRKASAFGLELRTNFSFVNFHYGFGSYKVKQEFQVANNATLQSILDTLIPQESLDYSSTGQMFGLSVQLPLGPIDIMARWTLHIWKQTEYVENTSGTQKEEDRTGFSLAQVGLRYRF